MTEDAVSWVNIYNRRMCFEILTYNVLFNKAYNKIGDILAKSHPDIICLQEIDTDENNLVLIEKHGYKLADFSNSFLQFGRIFGVATFYNPATCKLQSSDSFYFSNSLTEIIFSFFQILLGINKPRTVLETIFTHTESKKTIAVYNAHLIMFASNELRLKHLNEILEIFINPKKLPTVICGDFNYYPYRRKKLEDVMMKYHFIEATQNIGPTIHFSSNGEFERFNFIQKVVAMIINKTHIAHRLKTDYIFYRLLKLHQTTKIDIHCSDHFPIISKFTI